eukprot:scaffold32412_cov26-Tisochrysis_lutea.AAC.2
MDASLEVRHRPHTPTPIEPGANGHVEVAVQCAAARLLVLSLGTTPLRDLSTEPNRPRLFRDTTASAHTPVV